MRRPRRFDRRDSSGFGCTVTRTPRVAGSLKWGVPSQERPRRRSGRALPDPRISAAVSTAAGLLRGPSPQEAPASRDRLFSVSARALLTIPDRLADDRDLVGFKLALLGAALVLVTVLG